MSGIPKQVQDQIDAADQLHQQLYGDKTPADPATPVAVVVPPAAEPAPEPTPAPAEPTPAEPTPDPAPQDPPKAPDADPNDESAKWEQRYKTLQGMYDAEVPRLKTAIKNLESEVTRLQGELDAATARATEAETRQQELSNLVTDEERQEFGEDLIEVQRKVAREETADLHARIDSLVAQNAELTKQLNGTDQKVATASFETRLAQLVPDFETINADPRWIAWLQEVDPMLRGPRMAAAQTAFSEGDAEGVAHFVKLWKATLPAEPATDPKPDAEVETQIQPPRNATPPAPVADPQQIYTSEQVRLMFAEVAKLNRQGKLSEAQKLEATIDTAYRENRVRG